MQRLQKHIALCSDLIELSDLPGSPFVEDVNDLRRTRRFAFLHAFRFFYLRSFADAYEIAQAEKLPAELTKQIGAIIERVFKPASTLKFERSMSTTSGNHDVLGVTPHPNRTQDFPN